MDVRVAWEWDGGYLLLVADALWQEAVDGNIAIPKLTQSQADALQLPLKFSDGFEVLLDVSAPQPVAANTAQPSRFECRCCHEEVKKEDMREHIAMHILKLEVQPHACGRVLWPSLAGGWKAMCNCITKGQ
jgi:hypothetical protein